VVREGLHAEGKSIPPILSYCGSGTYGNWNTTCAKDTGGN